LLDWLGVAPEAGAQVLAHDPSFSSDLAAQRAELTTRRGELAASFERGDSDELIRQRVEAVIAAGAAIERRVTNHLLSVREYLTPQQQSRLLELCAEGVRQGPGWRWRRGQSSDGADSPGRGLGPRYRGGRGAGQ
jgi:hypothetical protein